MDFSAYYTAGESLNTGLSPYQNNFQATPSIWDGVNFYTTSRFLYPPLIANFFQLFSIIPYRLAKIVWSIVNLGSIFYSLTIIIKLVTSDKKKQRNLFFLSMIVTCIFFPMYTYFERGQIDAVTLLCLVLGVEGLRKEKFIQSGLFIALAMLIKINIFLLLPVLLIKKYRKTFVPLILTLTGICILSLIINGWENNKNYLFSELPRIIKYNQAGPDANLVPFEELIVANNGYSLDKPHKQGIEYDQESLSFFGNGSIIRSEIGLFLSHKLANHLPFTGDLTLFVILYFGCVGVISLLILYRIDFASVINEVAFWGLIITILLLISPLTWVMNYVWFIILFPVLFIQIAENVIVFRNKKKVLFSKLISMALGLIGFFIIAIPDTVLLKMELINENSWVLNKYPIGSMFVFSWLFIYLICSKTEIFREWKIENFPLSRGTQ